MFRGSRLLVVIFHKKVMEKMRNMTKMIMDDKNHLYLSEKSRMIDS